MKKLAPICLSGLLSMSIFSCKPRDPDGASLQHEENAPTRGNGSWQWKDITEEEYFNVVAPYLKLPDRDAFITTTSGGTSAERELATRVQFWISAFDSNLRRRHPDAMKNVPIPKVAVVRDAEANAFVSPVPVCLAVPIRFNTHVPVSPASILKFASYSTDGFLVPEFPENDKPICIRREFTRDHLLEVVRWFNSYQNGCLVSLRNDAVTGQSFFEVSSGCPIDPELEKFSKAETLIVVTTANYLTVNTGLIAQFPEHEWMILPTIAHELGHYYRSHMTTFSHEYGFLYRVDRLRAGSRPEADPALKERGKLVYQSAKFLAARPVEGQRTMSALYVPMTAIVHSVCKEESPRCHRDCQELNDLITAGELDAAFGDFPDEDLLSDKIPFYRRYEKLLGKCAKRIAIGNSNRPNTLRESALRQHFARAELDALLWPLPTGPHLGDVLKKLQEKSEVIASTAAQNIAKAESDMLARYTIETEADEFGLEQFAHLGFDPKGWIESDLVFNRPAPESEPEVPSPEDLSMEECETLYRNKWKNGSGVDVVPPRGGFYEIHPNACFRIYNVDREIRDHRLQAGSGLVPAPTGSPWSSLVALAKAAAAVAPAE